MITLKKRASNSVIVNNEIGTVFEFETNETFPRERSREILSIAVEPHETSSERLRCGRRRGWVGIDANKMDERQGQHLSDHVHHLMGQTQTVRSFG